VQATYGPSGTLRDQTAGGARAEVFASANMARPESLSAAGKRGPVVRFTRNQLCALVRPGLAVKPAELLAQMRDDGVRIATSAPKADPSGHYAFAVFAKAQALCAGRIALRSIQATAVRSSLSATVQLARRVTLVLKGRVLYWLQSMARFELPTKLTVLPMIWVQLVVVLAPPANWIAPVGT
jgi:molybdate transport system substrate-binding protein